METNQRLWLKEIKPSGRVELVEITETARVVCDFDKLLQKYLDTRPVVVCLSHQENIWQGVHLGARFLFKKLPALRLRTVFRILLPREASGNVSIATPTWGRDAEQLRPESETELSWVPPEGASIWLINQVGPNNAWWLPIALKDPLEPHPLIIRKLPIGNQYDDGRICMGTDFLYSVPSTLSDSPKDLVDYTAKSYEYLSTSNWNSDLTNTSQIRRSEELFQWKLPEAQQVPVMSETVKRNCSATGGPYTECLEAILKEVA